MQQNFANGKLRNALERTLADHSLKKLLERSKELWEIVGSNVSDIPYLPIVKIEDPKLPWFHAPCELVIKEDGYYAQTYQTYTDPFEDLGEANDRFPFGWHVIKSEKISINEIVGKFPYLTEKRFLRDVSYQMALREEHIHDYRKYCFLPHYTFMDKIEYHLANLMSKEIKWLKFLDFWD